VTKGMGMVGAYGLRLDGVAGAEGALVAAAADWPRVHVSAVVGTGEAGAEFLDDRRARARLRTGGWIDMDREAGRAAFTVPAPLSPEELVHPFLAPVAAIFSRWHGREALHGGGIALGGQAYGVIGERESGKSSLLAALAARGVDVVCDDVLVVEGREAFAGPRTVDLRREAATELGLGTGIGFAGARERWRMALEPLDRVLSLAGWIFPVWADETTLARVAASEVLERLLRNRATGVAPEDPGGFLQLSALPAWELRRPRSWGALPGTLDRLLERLGS
jgi:hypothetical protein